MDITITGGTNAKSQRVTRIRVEISDHDLAAVDGDPDDLLRIVKRSRAPLPERLVSLGLLAKRIEDGHARRKK